MIKKVIKAVLWFILSIILAFVLFLAYQSATEFNPTDEQVFNINQKADTIGDTLTIVSWNLGYFGLGAEMDFFYEGGKNVMPTEQKYEKYSKWCLNRIARFNNNDFIFFQEVDTASRRSYFNNQYNQINSRLPNYKSWIALNYNAWVPVPIGNSMGKVNAGLMTLSKASPVSAKRVSFQSSYHWPLRLFQLKRCYLETRFLTVDGKQLVLVNTHNSAFGDAAELREVELNTLKHLMIEEYKKGNYVIIGGDWNQNPPDFDSSAVLPVYKARMIKPGIPPDFLPQGWSFAYDPLHTTNRYVNIPYVEGKTFSTLIDFFVLSPNIRLQEVKTIPNSYLESDHQPVRIRVKLQLS